MSSNFRGAGPRLSNSYNFVRPKDEVECAYLESFVREDYERAHPGETFDGMKRRMPYSREDSGLYHDWLAIAVDRAAMASIEGQG